jgi:hypothetical protein
MTVIVGIIWTKVCPYGKRNIQNVLRKKKDYYNHMLFVKGQEMRHFKYQKQKR